MVSGQRVHGRRHPEAGGGDRLRHAVAIFPLIIIVVAAAGFVLRDNSVREEVIEEVLAWLPLRPDRGRADLAEVLDAVTEGSAALGAIGFAGLLLPRAGGAAVGALAFEAVKQGFAFYLTSIASIAAVYASMATVVAFLLFVWVAANVFLFGGEVAEVLGRRSVSAPASAP